MQMEGEGVVGVYLICSYLLASPSPLPVYTCYKVYAGQAQPFLAGVGVNGFR